MNRSSGILLHITSLPSKFGIGDLGPSAYKFLDYLKSAGQSYWQILPLNPTDGVNAHSPYSSFSAFGSNTLLISTEWLEQNKLISKKEMNAHPSFSKRGIDFHEVIVYKQKILGLAYQHFVLGNAFHQEFNDYCQHHAEWLDDFALFVVFKKIFHHRSWVNWPKEIKFRLEESLLKYKSQYSEEINQIKFQQFIFDRQWQDLKRYAHERGIKIMGDLPIYVNHDSVDVWENPKYFKLDEDFNPTVVAGVPPDDFSKTGQRWGNPVYDWDYMKAHQFDWWIKRFKRNFEYFDCIRIDHFRGFINYWEIPVTGEALDGWWKEVPTDEFFNELRKAFHQFPVIAEDLGMIDDRVRAKIHSLGFPGMKILLFAFNGDLQYHPYLPHNFPESSVVYTGTHDNNTIIGWYKNEMTPHEKKNLIEYLKKRVTVKNVHWALIELALHSKADLAVMPMQDVLGLGSEARMNKPATIKDNWDWRLLLNEMKPKDAAKLHELTRASGRIAE